MFLIRGTKQIVVEPEPHTTCWDSVCVCSKTTNTRENTCNTHTRVCKL